MKRLILIFFVMPFALMAQRLQEENSQPYLQEEDSQSYLQEEDFPLSTVKSIKEFRRLMFMLKYLQNEKIQSSKMIQDMLVNYPELVNGINSLDRNTLQEAIDDGYIEVVKYLVEERGINLKLKQYLKAALRLIEREDLEMLKYLVDERDVDLNRYARSAIKLAIKNRNIEILRYLVDEKGLDLSKHAEVAVLSAIEVGSIETLRYLVDEKGLDLSKYAEAAVLSAIEVGSIETLRYLVDEKGLDLSKYAEAAVLSAIKNRRLEIVKYLMKRGFDIKEGDLELIKGSGPEYEKVIYFLKEALILRKALKKPSSQSCKAIFL